MKGRGGRQERWLRDQSLSRTANSDDGAGTPVATDHALGQTQRAMHKAQHTHDSVSFLLSFLSTVSFFFLAIFSLASCCRFSLTRTSLVVLWHRLCQSSEPLQSSGSDIFLFSRSWLDWASCCRLSPYSIQKSKNIASSVPLNFFSITTFLSLRSMSFAASIAQRVTAPGSDGSNMIDSCGRQSTAITVRSQPALISSSLMPLLIASLVRTKARLSCLSRALGRRTVGTTCCCPGVADHRTQVISCCPAFHQQTEGPSHRRFGCG